MASTAWAALSSSVTVQVAVDAQGYLRIGLPEPAADGQDVNTGRDQARCVGVTQGVQINSPACDHAGAQPIVR
jgi:hypothetical protein